MRQLEPFVGEFLYTHVDREGLMQGTDMAAIARVRARHVARGDRRRRHHDAWRRSTSSTRMGVDAVVGMALYTGRLALPKPRLAPAAVAERMLSSPGAASASLFSRR